MIRRKDMSGPLKFGTVKTSESFLKLYCHGLVERLNRNPMFDELERIHAFLDLAQLKQYKNRLYKIWTKDVKKRLELVYEIMNIKDMFDLLDITEKGTKILKIKRKEDILLYDKINKEYANDKIKFYENVSLYEQMLPMMFVMGFTGGVMMSLMASSSMQYAIFDQSFNSLGDMVGGNDFDASGFDFGGF